MNGTTFLHFIGGGFVGSASDRLFEKRSPVDGSLIGMIAEGGQVEVDAAVRAGTEAMSGPWRRLTLAQRTDMLHAVAREIDRRFERARRNTAPVLVGVAPECGARRVCLPEEPLRGGEGRKSVV